MSDQIPPELVQNLQTFSSPESLDVFSVYLLFPEEKLLFGKYYQPGDKILDLACGMGRTTLCLHEMGCSVRGTDVSPNLIKTAQRRFPYLDLRVGSSRSN